MRPSAVTLVIAGLAVAAALAAIVPALAPARPLSGLLLVTILPGVAIVRLLKFPTSDGLGALALGVPLSLALAVLTGLALNLLNALDAAGWAASLCALTLLACLARRADARTTVDQALPSRLRPGEIAMLLAAAAIVAGGVAVAREGAKAHREFAYTEFWMTPRPPVDQNIVTLGIRNAEREPTSYRVAIVADGANVGRWPSVALAPGEIWTADISLNAQFRRARRVEAWLYRSQDPDLVYRKAWIAAPAAKARRD